MEAVGVDGQRRWAVLVRGGSGRDTCAVSWGGPWVGKRRRAEVGEMGDEGGAGVRTRHEHFLN